jgi:hypothetical protein
VLGGLHGDIPLEATGGALIADLIVDRGVSMILDVSQFESDADKARFAQAFAERFFFRKKASPSAVHVFIEECQEFVPQNPQREEGRMLHAFTRMAKIGRNFGIGLSLISQRPQEVNKKVLNLTELLFAFQLTGPQERKTVQGWIADKGIDEDIAGELPKLEQGQPHVWSPAWLKISKRIKIAPKWTFDASSTPLVGRQAAARDLSPIDLEQLRTAVSATIERAKAEDPRLLRKRIAELERAKPSVAPDKTTLAAEFERGHAEGFHTARASMKSRIDDVDTLFSKATSELEKARTELLLLRHSASQQPQAAPRAARQSAPVVRHQPKAGNGAGSPAVGKSGLRRMMIALAQRPGLSRGQLGVRARLSSRSGSFDTYLSRMRSSGWLDGGPGDFRLTQTGLAALGSYEPLPQGRDLLEYWLRDLGNSGAARILRALAESYPKSMTRAELGEAAVLSDRSGSFDTYLSRLRSLELVVGRGELTASEELF